MRPGSRTGAWSAREVVSSVDSSGEAILLHIPSGTYLGLDRSAARIVELLNQRTEIVHEIGRIKRQFALPIYEPKREDQVFENVTAHNPGPLTADALKRIFERIIDEMRTIQQKKMG